MTFFRLLALILGFTCLAQAQLNQTPMSEKEIYVFLGGNTIGAHDWGVADSFEYHSHDGRALWREGEELNVGYYRVKGSQVCYTYEGEDIANWFCWEFKRDLRTGQVYQWTDYGDYYRLYIYAEGDLVTSGEIPDGS